MRGSVYVDRVVANARIAADLDEIADLLELQDANPFRVRAFRNGARTVRDLARPVEELLEAGEDLRGMEVDIHADGSLDADDDLLERMDVVVVSVHSGFELPQERQSERVVAALRHPQVNMLAHPTGRLLGRREGIRTTWGRSPAWRG